MSTRKPFAVRMLAAAAAALLFSAGAAHAAAPAKSSGQPCDLDRPERQFFLPKDRIIGELGLRPGMTVLDLGAGKGYLTFDIARAVGARGKVYATDVNPAAVEYLDREKRSRGHRNVFPALVSTGTAVVERVYAEHRFDVILLCDVCGDISDRVSLFKQLRPSLAPRTGRLFVIDAALNPAFTQADFKDAGEVLRRLGGDEAFAPLARRLSPELREYLKRGDLSQPAPARYAALLVDDFNAMLADRELISEMDGYYAARNYERDLARNNLTWNYVRSWLRYQLADEGILEKDESALTGYERGSLRMLNYLILSSVFSRDLTGEYYISSYPVFPVRRTIIRELETAGFRFVRSHDVLPRHYLLEFSRE